MENQKVLHAGLENIPNEIGIHFVWEDNPLVETEGQLKLTFKNREILFNIEIKKEILEHQLPNLETVAKNKKPFLLVVHYLRPKIKAELRKRNIAYLEINGNIFINHENCLILIDVNKPFNLAKETGNRAFTKTGLKVVYLYLTEEPWLNEPQRKIAKKTGTGLGNISNVNHGLQKENFLLKIDRTQKMLNNKQGLLDKWMKAYAVKLQPALGLGHFRFADEKNFIHYRKIQLDENTFWGGEPAGDILTDYLRPGELTLYTNNTRTELMRKYKLIPDPNGNVKIFNAFWDTTGQQKQKTVHPLLVYVDLMNTGDNRCYETAQMIWKKYLANEF
jgi:hypothetical protein